jgi:hypothetical protein
MARQRPPRSAVEKPQETQKDSGDGESKLIVARVDMDTYLQFVMYCTKTRKRSREIEAGRIIQEHLKANGYTL